MNPSQFLVRGLLAGLIAGLAAFAVAYVAGEPQVNAAIALEEAHEAHAHEAPEAAAEPEPGMTEVSRHNQSTWGLLTGTLSIGVAMGGLAGLGAAFAVGRLGQLKPAASTALIALAGFVSIGLAPFLKYPATPPAVGNPDTIGQRTELYFAMLGISVVAMIVAMIAGAKLADKTTAYRAIVVASLEYLAVIVTAGALLPTVNEVGSFPADTLWFFRRASILTTAALWGTLGIVLTGLIGRLHIRYSTEQARKEWAASL